MLRLNYKKMKNKPTNHLQKGITLIEILVVVAILLLLLVALFRLFGSGTNRARDAQRKNDLKNIKLAFEDYYNDNQRYPPEEYLDDCGGDSLQPYLKAVPCDPTTGNPYIYLLSSGNDSYRVLSILEDLSDPIIEKIGCIGGCGGIPESNPRYTDRDKYVYAIAEGEGLAGGLIVVPTAEPEYCETHACYCCSNSAYTSSQDCNVWASSGGNNCDMGPYLLVSDCYENTPCASDE
jgi:prepilin-type N-terminal cleavage/methylation domain-containing protein